MSALSELIKSAVIKVGWTKLIRMIAMTYLVIIVLPQEWAQKLGYEALIKHYRGWISLVGIASFALC